MSGSIISRMPVSVRDDSSAPYSFTADAFKNSLTTILKPLKAFFDLRNGLIDCFKEAKS